MVFVFFYSGISMERSLRHVPALYTYIPARSPGLRYHNLRPRTAEALAPNYSHQLYVATSTIMMCPEPLIVQTKKTSLATKKLHP